MPDLTLTLLLSLLVELCAVTSYWLIGSKDIRGHYLSIVSQIFWFILALATGAYFVCLGSLFFTAIGIRNIALWRHDAAHPSPVKESRRHASA